MKKVSLLVLICMLVSLVLVSFAGCEEEVVHTHTYGDEWIMDNTNHYHVCSCGAKDASAAHADANNDEACDVCGITMKHTVHTFGSDWVYDATNHYHVCAECSAKDASAAHNDADNNGACDTCGVIMAHEHVFDSAWTSNATDHWHAPLCGHSVEVNGKAAHTPDDFGKCTVCGYKVGEPDVSTVEKALAFAAKAQGVVLGGKYTVSSEYSNEGASFEVGDGYIHMVSGEYNLYATKNADGTVCLVVTDPTGFATVDKASTDVKYLNGPVMDLQNIIDVQQTVYGVLELLNFFYEDFTALAPEGTDVVVTETVADGVYSYSYSLTVPSEYAYMPAYTYAVAVSFTLDEENYFIDNVTATINKSSDYSESAYTFNYDQWIKPTSNHTPEDITPTEAVKFEYDYEPVVFDENGVAPTIKINLGYPSFFIKISDFTNSDALIEALGIDITFMNGEEEYYGASYSYDPVEKYITVTVGEWIDTAVDFNMVIAVGAETYTFPVSLTYADTYGIGIYEGDGWSGMNPFYEGIAYVGEEILLYAFAGQGTEKNAYTATIIDGPATDALTLAANEGLGEYEQYKNKTYIFKTYIPGVYTVEFTSTLPLEEGETPLVATALIVVLDTTPAVETTAIGKWTTPAEINTKASVSFYPQDEGNTKGVALVKVTARVGEQVAVFTYYIHEGEFVATPVGQLPVMIQTLTIDSSYNVVINEANEYGSISLNHAGNTAEAWDVDALGEMPVAPGYDPDAPVTVVPGTTMNRTELFADAAGTYNYTTTIAAGETGYFYLTNPASTNSDAYNGEWDENWVITVVVDGATVVTPVGGVTNAAFDAAGAGVWGIKFDIQNEGDAEAPVTITVTVAEAAAE